MTTDVKTPRTEAAPHFWTLGGGQSVVLTKFAKQLETELIEAQATIAQMHETKRRDNQVMLLAAREIEQLRGLTELSIHGPSAS